MKKRLFFPIVTVALALATTVARFIELRSGFDASGLPVAGSFAIGLMHGAVVTSVVLAVVLGAAFAPKHADYAHCISVGVGKVLVIASGFMLAASGIVGIATAGGASMRLVLAAFALIGGACAILALKSKDGFLATPPVFFCCFLMLLLYVEQSDNANLEQYGYLVLAAAAATGCTYCAASAAFGVTRTRFKLAASAVAAVLCAVSVLTTLVGRDLQLMLGYGALSLFALGEVFSISLYGQDQPFPAPADDAEDNTEADTEDNTSESGTGRTAQAVHGLGCGGNAVDDAAPSTAVIYLAGGCYWGVEKYCQNIRGVLSTEVGFANGFVDAPTYEQVKHENTGHAETVRVEYSPAELPLRALLKLFFRIIDPTSVDRQGHDEGHQYRTGIYYTCDADRAVAADCLAELAAQYDAPLAVECLPLDSFWTAEEYHQKYLDKNPGGYCHVPLDLIEWVATVDPRTYAD